MRHDGSVEWRAPDQNDPWAITSASAWLDDGRLHLTVWGGDVLLVEATAPVLHRPPEVRDHSNSVRLREWIARVGDTDITRSVKTAVDDLEAAEERNRDLERLFDLQWTRMREATALWQRSHPGMELVWPDLGELLTWLMERDGRDAAT